MLVCMQTTSRMWLSAVHEHALWSHRQPMPKQVACPWPHLLPLLAHRAHDWKRSRRRTAWRRARRPAQQCSALMFIYGFVWIWSCRRTAWRRARRPATWRFCIYVYMVWQMDGVAPREAACDAEISQSRWYTVSQTDGVAPREAACDAVFRAVSAAGAEDPIIFNCQMGAGRTTTGMVIACLVRTFTTGAPGPRVSCEAHPGHPASCWCPFQFAYSLNLGCVQAR